MRVQVCLRRTFTLLHRGWFDFLSHNHAIDFLNGLPTDILPKLISKFNLIFLYRIIIIHVRPIISQGTL